MNASQSAFTLRPSSFVLKRKSNQAGAKKGWEMNVLCYFGPVKDRKKENAGTKGRAR